MANFVGVGWKVILLKQIKKSETLRLGLMGYQIVVKFVVLEQCRKARQLTH